MGLTPHRYVAKRLIQIAKEKLPSGVCRKPKSPSKQA